MAVGRPRRLERRPLAFGGILLVALVAVLLSPARARAQESSRWGVSVSLTPSWEISDSLKEQLFDEDETGTLKGTEFSIGFVRGRARGGDWGVSFVRKPFDDVSGVRSVSQQCVTATQCFDEIENNAFRGVYLNAFEVHWAPMFVTIKRRAQVGINIGGGLGWMHGEILKTTDSFDIVGFNPQTQKATLAPRHTEETLLAADELMKYFPLIKFEVVGGVVLTNALKVKVAYGANFPAYSGRVQLVYLFGS